MRVEKLPFTIYDIVGYFLPGAALLVSIAAFSVPDLLVNLYHSEILEKIPIYAWIPISIVLVIVPHALGYCIALISSEGIEKAFVKAYGYPSEFLVHGCRRPESSYKDNASLVRKMFLLHYLLRGSLRNRFQSIFVKQLGPTIIGKLDERFYLIFGINKEHIPSEEWFSLIENYVMNNSQPAFMRMYNYVTMYGFCRNLSAAVYFSAVVLFIMVTASIHFSPWMLSWHVTFRIYVAIAAMMLLSVMLAANFAKFYRRYSSEAILAFVTMEDPKSAESK
jgi:hypothetical protein